jgi:hypothetical protein
MKAAVAQYREPNTEAMKFFYCSFHPRQWLCPHGCAPKPKL